MNVSMRILACAVLVVALCAAAAPEEAVAQNSPVGLWSVTFYNDATPNLNQMATQRICFLANGTWFSTTFPGWAGRWFQRGVNAAGNGDRVRISGNYAGGVGNDSAELDFVHIRLMTGPWTEWRDGFPFLVWTRLAATRIGTCTQSPAFDINAVDDGTNPMSAVNSERPVCDSAFGTNP